MALLSWGLSSTYRLLGIRMHTQKETKDGSYIYWTLQRTSMILGWKNCQEIGHYTFLMICEALVVENYILFKVVFLVYIN